MTIGAELARRAIARDDLLTVAVDAEAALGILRLDRLSHRNVQAEPDLFVQALERHLADAERCVDADSWPLRAGFLTHAASIARFCSLVGRPLPSDPLELLAQAVGEIRNTDHDLDVLASDSSVAPRDVTADVMVTYRLAREARLGGDPERGLEIAERSDAFFHGSGAEPHRGRFEYEIAASLGALGQAGQIHAAIGENEAFWHADHAVGWPSRSRHELAMALPDIVGGDWPEAIGRLDAAHRILTEERDRAAAETLTLANAGPELHLAQEVSIGATSAEVLRAMGAGDERAAKVLLSTIDLLGEVRSRWKVIVRSTSPLAIAFRMLYGDLARIASGLDGVDADSAGLKITVASKQTGFAGLIRSDRLSLPPKVQHLVDEIVDIEQGSAQVDVSEASRKNQLEDKRKELQELVSPMFAEMVLPESDSSARVIAKLDRRVVVDFLRLPDLDDETRWYRTFVDQDGRPDFEAIELGRWHRVYTDGDDRFAPLDGRFRNELHGSSHREVWRGLAAELLPARLLELVTTERAADDPVPLVICPHEELSTIPWSALIVDDHHTRLVQRAVVTVAPALTWLSGSPSAPDLNRALVRLVGKAEAGVDTDPELEAWGIPSDVAHGTVVRCSIPDGRERDPVGPHLLAALREQEPVDFVHVAAHGRGTGLEQGVVLGGESITAGSALSVSWPDSVLLASCHVGEMENVANQEPFGLVAIMLAAGATTVVAGMHLVSDRGTGIVSGRAVRNVQSGASLLEALRSAQLLVCDGPAREWALLTTFTV